MGQLGNRELENSVVTIYFDQKKLEIDRDPSVMTHYENKSEKDRPQGVTTCFYVFGADVAPKGNAVGRIAPGSLADKLGIQVADRIVSVNGYKTPSSSFIVDSYTRKKIADPLTAVVMRAGKEVKLSLP